MFAILITPENEAKILETGDLTDSQRSAVKVALKLTSEWYFIRGYYSDHVRFPINTLLPAYIFAKRFEYDADKIKTDWDMIVRK